jgi:hypothetical protein
MLKEVDEWFDRLRLKRGLPSIPEETALATNIEKRRSVANAFTPSRANCTRAVIGERALWSMTRSTRNCAVLA